ncbi:MAG: hypothetical protein HN623_04140 [Bdellovibrionales bacterium]|jgi:V8-like Glu-specific endopeptidase|nr:hypothetical protein [Bdellovibrionales bacterium]
MLLNLARQTPDLTITLMQGFAEISYSKIKRGLRISITGYGASAIAERSYAQQYSEGKVKRIKYSKTIISHRADSAAGSSGSAIISRSSNKIIGIHTRSGCGDLYRANRGTLIYRNTNLIEAIKACTDGDL